MEADSECVKYLTALITILTVLFHPGLLACADLLGKIQNLGKNANASIVTTLTHMLLNCVCGNVCSKSIHILSTTSSQVRLLIDKYKAQITGIYCIFSQ